MSTELMALSQQAPKLVGLFLPPLITIINKDVHGERNRFIVTVLLCLVVAVFLHLQQLFMEDAFSGSIATLNTLLVVFGESQAVYRMYFKGSRLEEVIEEKLDR